MIKAWGLTKTIRNGEREIQILKGIDLEVPTGQFLAITGVSGSGKSTLLGLLAGFDTPSSGSIQLDGEEISGLSEDQLARVRGRKIGFVFQSYQLIPTLTAEENVMLPLELCGERDADVSRARALLEHVGLAHRRHHYPVQLSGGEQQRVALARALILRPPILMADEPTGNLDSRSGRLVMELLTDRAERTTLILATHNQELAANADRVVTLEDGLII